MNNQVHKTWIEIDADAIRHNLNLARKLIGPKVAIMAIIKANAYGHGLFETANILQKLTSRARQSMWCGVDSVDEAQTLRKCGIKNPIMILGYVPENRILEVLQRKFHASIYNKETLASVEKILKRNPQIAPRFHLKIETGTNRLGIQLRELRRIKNFPPIEGIYTHFADSENPSSAFYQAQLSSLRKAENILASLGIYPRYFHAASTAALLQFPETRGNLVRFGIGLYGLWPSEDVRRIMSDKLTLRPVLTWKTRIAQIKKIQKRETVGYDRTFCTRSSKFIAILPVGYYDGYDRRLSNCGEVLINGRRARVIGNVCMNMMMVDLGGISARVGDTAVLIGKSGKLEISADEIADKIGTINYEVIARISSSIPRIFKNNRH